MPGDMQVDTKASADAPAPDTALYMQLKAQDPTRALLSLRVDAVNRPALWALYLFNTEIARVRESVTDTTLGLIRLQWWRDRLSAIYAGQGAAVLRDHPVLPYLAHAIAQVSLPQDDFETLLYAREFDLSDVLPANLTGVANYAEFTNLPLLRLSLQIARQDPGTPGLAQLAIAFGMVGLMRAVTFHARQRRCFLPEDMVVAAGLSTEQIFAGRDPDKLAPIVSAVLDEAQRQLDMADGVNKKQDLPPLVKALRHATKLHMAQMRKSGCNPADARYHAQPFAYALRLLMI